MPLLKTIHPDILCRYLILSEADEFVPMTDLLQHN